MLLVRFHIIVNVFLNLDFLLSKLECIEFLTFCFSHFQIPHCFRCKIREHPLPAINYNMTNYRSFLNIDNHY